MARNDVTIKYSADDSKFQKVTKRVKSTAKNVTKELGSIGSAITGLFSRSLSGAITAAGVGFAAIAKSALSFADAIAKTSDRIGVGIEELQRWRYAASTAGVDTRTLDLAIQRFSRRIGEAAQGFGVLRRILPKLGVEIKNVDGSMRNVSDVLLDYADALQKTEDPQERLRLAVAAFDIEGAKLVNLMSQGKTAIEAVFLIAEELGLVLENRTVRQAEALNQAWSDFSDSIAGKAKKALLGLVTSLAGIAGQYRKAENAQDALAEEQEKLAELEQSYLDSIVPAMKVWYQFRVTQSRKIVASLEDQVEAFKNAKSVEQALVDVATTPSTVAQYETLGEVQDALKKKEIELAKATLQLVDADSDAKEASQDVADALKDEVALLRQKESALKTLTETQKAATAATAAGSKKGDGKTETEQWQELLARERSGEITRLEFLNELARQGSYTPQVNMDLGGDNVEIQPVEVELTPKMDMDSESLRVINKGIDEFMSTNPFKLVPSVDASDIRRWGVAVDDLLNSEEHTITVKIKAKIEQSGGAGVTTEQVEASQEQTATAEGERQ